MTKKKVTLEDLSHDPSLVDTLDETTARRLHDEFGEVNVAGNVGRMLASKVAEYDSLWVGSEEVITDGD